MKTNYRTKRELENVYLDEISHKYYNIYINLAKTLLNIILERDKKLPTSFI